MAQFLTLSLTAPAKDRVPDGPAGDAAPCPPGLDDVAREEITIRPEHRLVFHTAPQTPGADRIRCIRMHLRRLRESRNLKTVLITSPIAHDGKSTLALNLATALSSGGKSRVLLIEADLHHAPLISQFGLADRQEGLGDCLERGTDPISVCRLLEPLGWYLLPAGKLRHNPTDLLQTKAYGAVLNALSPCFDWIFVDSPPVLPLTDALFLRQHSDATLLVVRAGRTPCDAVEEAVRQIGRQHLLGIVLNGVAGLDRLYYGYGGGYYGSGKPGKGGRV
jgi:capsular exopolysaccharide synthesis family protein